MIAFLKLEVGMWTKYVRNQSLLSGLSALSLGLTLSVATSLPAYAADKVKIGFISTLSGPSAGLGVDIRDAFMLAVKLNGGKIGGLDRKSVV